MWYFFRYADIPKIVILSRHLSRVGLDMDLPHPWKSPVSPGCSTMLPFSTCQEGDSEKASF